MSRIGNKAIAVPDKVSLTEKDGIVLVKGPKGEISAAMPKMVTVEVNDGVISVKRTNDGRIARANHGLARSLVNNLVIGVSAGYKKDLEINGVGYKVDMVGAFLRLDLGFSHPIFYDVPKGIELKIDRGTKLSVLGIDKVEVGRTAAIIRSFRPPEPYKGKGIKYADEHIVRKVGKAGGK